jgi:hypothetical protein
MVSLRRITDSGPFDFRWPTITEHFASGWEATVVADGRSARFLHAIGERDVYGRRRPHTVTFLDGHAVVEGVAADDYERSLALLSLIKPTKGHTVAKDAADIPRSYRGFDIVSHRDEIDAPYSKRCLALKIRVDDVEQWACHAVLRRRIQGRGS